MATVCTQIHVRFGSLPAFNVCEGFVQQRSVRKDVSCKVDLLSVQALSNDAAFVRVRKGVYALRALAGNVGPVPHNTPKGSRGQFGRGLDHRDSYRYAYTLQGVTAVTWWCMPIAITTMYDEPGSQVPPQACVACTNSG